MAKGMSFKVLMQLQTKEFQQGIKNIQRQLTGFKNFMKSAFALGSITMFGRQMVQVGKDFENAMARVQSVSNATTEEFRKMQAEAQRLGSTTRYTATEAAEALENLTRNGMSAANATKSLSSVLQLAQANSIGLADAANIVTNTLNMFNLSVDQANRVNDVLSSTASHAATDITSLYEAMTNAAPAANVLGFSIEEVSSAIGALAQKGVKGSEAGTKLRIAFQKMADPKVVAKMHEYGIEVDENTMKTEGLRKTVEKIGKANLSLGQLGKIFDAKSAMAVQQLVASLEDLDYMLDVTANSAGETERMFNQGVGTVQKELDSLKSMYEGLLITISQKTGGVIKGAIKLLQNLIANFETVGGTIANIASVAVPLLTKRVLTLGTTLKTMFTQAAAGAATMQAAMGGWITIIATLVTWIGTALVGAWSRATKEMREAKKEMDNAERSSKNLQMAVDRIKNKIGDGSNKGTLNSALREATQLFPEFAEAINNAKKIAEKTGEWEKLKGVLQDIADLQNLVTRREAQERVYAAQTKQVGGEMWNNSKGRAGYTILGAFGRRNRDGQRGLSYETTDEIGNAFKKHLLKTFDKDTAKDIFNDMGKVFVDALNDNIELPDSITINGNVVTDKESIKEWTTYQNSRKAVKDFMSSYGFELGKNQEGQLSDWLNRFTPYHTSHNTRTGAALNTQNDIERTDSASVATNFKIIEREVRDGLSLITGNSKEENEERYRLAKKFYDDVMDLGFGEGSKELQEAADLLGEYSQYAPKPSPSGGSGGGSSSSKTEKTNVDLVKDAIDDYNKNVEKLDNRLKAGTITQKDYDAELKNLVDTTWETVTAISGFEEALEQLKQTATGTKLSELYKENRTGESNKKIDELYSKLFAYTSEPKRETRDARFDYSKTKNEIAKEEVDIEFNYAEALNRMVEELQDAIESGEFEPIKGDAIAQLERLKEAALNASAAAETLQDKLNLSTVIATLNEQIEGLKQNAFDTFTGLAQALDRVNNSLLSIAEIFDEDLKDSPLFQAYEAFSSSLNASIQAMSAVASMLEVVSKLEKKKSKEKVKNTVEEILANEAATKSELKRAAAEAGEAAAGGASAVASIPYVGPALAVAAAISIAAAIAAAMAKFEHGGIIGGNSTSGDHVPIMANSKEMVLTQGQQATLFNAIKSGNLGGGGAHEFRVRGCDLVSVLNNEMSRRRG